jgi:2-hydroxy-3-keto-5-methylthiopentenyl-1-phosphate phosphatase
VDALRRSDETVVFIGDGYSDMCVSGYADVVFAKNQLLSYCKSSQIPCISYNAFSDILDWYRKQRE